MPSWGSHPGCEVDAVAPDGGPGVAPRARIDERIDAGSALRSPGHNRDGRGRVVPA